VNLDEAGYHGLAELDSPPNMKRFVCRVVDKIFCKVRDESSLELFVPYYSSLEKHETYEHLEQELLEICHAGDKWVVPSHTPTEPTATPVSPLPNADPCARAPDDTDVVGNAVSLDEAGYTSLAALRSPSNTKRFICRVVQKITCKVTDEGSLDAFVPYYSSIDSHETYAHLEQQLVELCQAGDKWLVSSR